MEEYTLKLFYSSLTTKKMENGWVTFEENGCDE